MTDYVLDSKWKIISIGQDVLWEKSIMSTWLSPPDSD